MSIQHRNQYYLNVFPQMCMIKCSTMLPLKSSLNIGLLEGWELITRTILSSSGSVPDIRVHRIRTRQNLLFGNWWTLPGISPESQSKSSHGHPARQLSSHGQFCWRLLNWWVQSVSHSTSSLQSYMHLPNLILFESMHEFHSGFSRFSLHWQTGLWQPSQPSIHSLSHGQAK